MEDMTFDGIIIGAGHNGLITAAYLAKAGLKVAVFESRPQIGGGFTTEEVTARGFKHNLHTIHAKLHDSPAHYDLDLARYGASYLFPDPKMAFVRRQEWFLLYQESERTATAIERISRRDAATYRRVAEKWHRWYLDFILPELYSPPKPPDQWEAELRARRGGDEYVDVALGYSPLEYSQELFESEFCRLSLQRGATAAEYDISTRGIPAVVFAHIINWFAGKTALIHGGTREAAEALGRCIEDHGGRVFLGQRVGKIIVERGAARGIALENGREVRASRFVASSIDPVHTFLVMIDDEVLPADVAERAMAFQFRKSSIFRVHLALEEPPRFTIAEREPDINRAWKFNVGFESPEDLVKMGEQARSGQIPEALGVDFGVITTHDPSQAPAGKHTAYVGVFAPFELAEGGADAWSSVADEAAGRVLAKLREYAPNMTDDNIVGRFSYTPKDIEEFLPDMINGDICQGKMCPEQLGYNRPWPGMSQYRTPIENLYLCGASTHPGGHAIGGPGYNAAGVIADDLGIDRWWRPFEPRKVIPEAVR